MRPLQARGKVVRGQQLNGLFNDITGITKYATEGGAYGLDRDILNNGGYPKNAIVCVDNVGLYRSLVDDNREENITDRHFWKLLVEFDDYRRNNRVVGELLLSEIRDKELMKQNGALLCDGSEYSLDDYPFVLNALNNNQLVSISSSLKSMMVRDNEWSPFIGWDRDKNTFSVPFYNGEMFLAPVHKLHSPIDEEKIMERVNQNRDSIPFKWDIPLYTALTDRSTYQAYDSRDGYTFNSLACDGNYSSTNQIMNEHENRVWNAPKDLTDKKSRYAQCLGKYIDCKEGVTQPLHSKMPIYIVVDPMYPRKKI